ncbi:uncharacterized protein BDCG_00189 [Blastomyces dermatitidis ER-3]|uniref:Uncharacterized protein n=1 Tax=Ajellomyces dermatitidis (strain ER-3 / ATCC MYA-2586) TaxID=559297 RepID=A0ABP2EMX1_AJEDR|nr:uncharacterized protein BDCG_00189 [Blastomyces dermatitidis ER-3]EEQ83384.1 hypothetical protein BDCG_00189 [Blastomyces dermatitidis ER-3]
MHTALLTNKLKAAQPTSAHSITQPPSRYPSPPGAVSYPPQPPIRYSSTPPPSPLSPLSTDPIFDAVNGDKSNDVDQQVKLALTELLNSASIKTHQDVRMWVQNKLMDTEHRLKARRKRRISNLGLKNDTSPLSAPLSAPGR